MIKKLIPLLAFCFILNSVQAQTKKVHADPLIWTEIQADYYLANQSFFFFRNQYRHNTNSDFAGINESGALSNLYQIYLQVGYDQKLTDHWRGAVSARYTFDAFNDYQVYQAALQHNGKIGATDFIKRISYDIMNFKEGDSRGRIRPKAALERNFMEGKHTLRPSLSYELFFYNDFNSDPALMETRSVDRSRLRIALNYKVSSCIWVTPYFMKQTEYYNVLTTYTVDSQGNQVVKEEGGKRNRIEPIFGIDLRFMLPGKNVKDTTIPDLGSLTETVVN